MGRYHLKAPIVLALAACAPHRAVTPPVRGPGPTTWCYRLTVSGHNAYAPHYLKLPLLVQLHPGGEATPQLAVPKPQADTLPGTWQRFGDDSLVIHWTHRTAEVLVSLHPQADSLKGVVTYWRRLPDNTSVAGFDAAVAIATNCP